MRLLFSILLLVGVFACNNNADEKASNDSTRIRELPVDSNDVSIEELSKENFYVWKVDGENKTITKNPIITEQYLNADTLIIGLNEMHPNIKLEKLKQSNDTLYTQIKDAEYFTNRTGSYGSEMYITQAVINLTSVKGIKFVNIDFEEGSHASPGIWSRKDFKDYKEVK